MAKTPLIYLPAVLLIVLIILPQYTTSFSHSVLGKMFCIATIVFYTSVDKYVGLLICGIVIYHYQTDRLETMMDMNEIFNYFGVSEKENVAKDVTLEKPDENAVSSFQHDNCVDGVLTYKGNEVKTDMAQHIFPEINYENKKCNPCDKLCKISIIEEEKVKEDNSIHLSTLN
jgi:hypothetical protein